MGLSAQNNGVSTTSVAVKMSMALSVILVMGLAREWTGISHIAALCLAILGVFFVSRQTEASGVPRKTWMLLVLFFGSSALDVVLFTIHRFFMPKGMNDGFFSSLGFLMAGLLGLTFFILQWKRKKIEFDGKKCRTTRINDVLRYILQIDNELDENKKGQISKNMSLSRVVESERIELSSKQVTKRLSTRLVFS